MRRTILDNKQKKVVAKPTKSSKTTVEKKVQEPVVEKKVQEPVAVKKVQEPVVVTTIKKDIVTTAPLLMKTVSKAPISDETIKLDLNAIEEPTARPLEGEFVYSEEEKRYIFVTFPPPSSSPSFLTTETSTISPLVITTLEPI